MSVRHVSPGASFLPTGSIIMWCGSEASIPPNMLLCDGTTVSQSVYKRLYGVIGNYYNTGGEAAGTFRLPLLSDKYIKGATPSTVTYAGSNTHSHSFTTSWTGGANASDGSHGHNSNSFSTGFSDQHTHGHTYNADTSTTSATSSSNANNTSGTAQTVSGSLHTHNFGISALNSFTTFNSGHSGSPNAFTSTGSGHNHGVTEQNATLNTNSSNQESSHFKTRALIKT